MVRKTVVAAACAALGLTGCNMVITHTPMFTKADQRDAPAIRGGIWNGAKPDCAFDETLPQSQWPKCADAQAPTPSPPPWIIAAGDPDILQMGASMGPGEAGIYFYVAFHPIKFDASRRATALELWPVLCGPPPKDGQPKIGENEQIQSSGMTKSLLPGLTVEKDATTCTTTSRAALFNAARASRAWIDPVGLAHWVRDPIPGDLTGSPVPQAATAPNS